MRKTVVKNDNWSRVLCFFGLSKRLVWCIYVGRFWKRSEFVGEREECEFRLGLGEFEIFI